MLHEPTPDEAVSARGPITIRYGPLFGSLKSMISTEQNFKKNAKDIKEDCPTRERTLFYYNCITMK